MSLATTSFNKQLTLTVSLCLDVANFDKQGISSRFLNFFNSIDHTVGQKVIGENQTVSGKVNEQASVVINKTKEVDQKQGVSAKLSEYYSKIVGTPVGQRWVTCEMLAD